MNLGIAIHEAKQYLYHSGNRTENKGWQSLEGFYPTLEVIGVRISGVYSGSLNELREDVRPNLPWADQHFAERVSGIPYNPPPSHVNWPFAKKENKTFIEGEKFSHTYPERIWGGPGGTLSDVVNLLKKDINTRQAFLPIWFPEDTGNTNGVRVPCTLGYQFLVREGKMTVIYSIRSCDVFRHLRDDVYMAARLGIWMSDQLGLDRMEGSLIMDIGSLHCFVHEGKNLLNAKY